MKNKCFKVMLLCICLLVLTGCKNDVKKKVNEKVNEKNENSITSELEKSGEPISSEQLEKVKKGLENWALITLGTDDKFSEEERQLIHETLYNSIVSEEQKNNLQKEYDKFYKDAKINVEEVDIDIQNTERAKLDSQVIGIVMCTATVTGIRNSNEFEWKYTMTLAVDYQMETASVYEIKNISFQQK